MTENQRPARPSALTSILRGVLLLLELLWVAGAIGILVSALPRLGEPNTWPWLVAAGGLLVVAGLVELARRRLPRNAAAAAPKTNGS